MSVTNPTIVDISEPIVQGDDFTFNGTLTASGTAINLNATSAATVTTSIYDERDPATKLLANISVTVAGGANGTITLTLTDVQTALLHAYINNPKFSLPHIADFKVVSAAAGNAVTHSDKWRLGVQAALT